MGPRPLVLIDTSAWIEALRKDGRPEVREKVRELMLTGRAAWNEMIMLELWNGARGRAEKAMLRQLTAEIPVLSIGPEVWKRANENAETCRSAGQTIPVVDLLIHACAQHYDVPLNHCDQHFDTLAKILPLANLS